MLVTEPEIPALSALVSKIKQSLEASSVQFTHFDGVVPNPTKKIGLWLGFKDVNVSKQDIREIADCGQVLGDYRNNPRVATIDEMYEMLMNCYER